MQATVPHLSAAVLRQVLSVIASQDCPAWITGKAAEVAPATPWPALPALPPELRPIPGSHIATPWQTFTAYTTRDGATMISLHATIELGDDTDASTRRIALISLNEHRVSIYPDRAGHGYIATWTADGSTCRLAAGPAPLHAFMDLLMKLRWPQPPA